MEKKKVVANEDMRWVEAARKIGRHQYLTRKKERGKTLTESQVTELATLSHSKEK